MSVVAIDNLAHRYPAQGKTPARDALRGVSFNVASGEIFGCLGPNGGGKTTLFKILSTYFPPTSGRAELFGLDLATRVREIRPRLGVVFQNPSLDRKLSVRENMVHQGRLYGLGGLELSSRIEEMLARYKLADRAGDLVEGLSGGLRRRVELAKGLLHRPELLLLDEPSTGLDPGARKDLWEHLAQLKAQTGVTILVTTHLMDEAERCDRLVLMDQGQVKTLGTPEELKGKIGGDVIAIESPDPGTLFNAIKSKFGVEPVRVDSTLRIERAKGHTFIPELVEAFPGMISSVSLGKPSLEDVFIHYTGHKFWAERSEA